VVDGAAMTLIVAEAGCNHNQSLELALELCMIAERSGADFVKFQTYEASRLYSRYTPIMPQFKSMRGMEEMNSMYDLIAKTQLSSDDTVRVAEFCKGLDVEFFSTPFSIQDVDFLEELDIAVYKVASFELGYLELLEYIGKTGKPVILSTGMGSLGDIERAKSAYINGLAKTKARPHEKLMHMFNVMHCVSNYPAKPTDYNLNTIPVLKAAFRCGVGLSDHTPGVLTSQIAAALGAEFIEKHITTDQELPGPDHSFSLTEGELGELVSSVRIISEMLGDGLKKNVGTENEMSNLGRRSLTAACDIKAGETVTRENITVKRPGYGIEPYMMEKIVGMTLTNDVLEDQPLEWRHFHK